MLFSLLHVYYTYLIEKGFFTLVILHLDDTVIKSLSSGELSILRYVYENMDDVLHMSIQELSKQVSYSTATILRFCKKLGFYGYAEFKYALRSEMQKPQTVVTKPQEVLTNKIIVDNLYTDIEGTSKLISNEQLERFFHYLDSDDPIYLWAPGGLTSILINYLEKLLFAIGRQNVYKIESSKMGEHIVRGLSKHHILFVISTTGDFAPTLRMAKLAKMNDIPIISITPYTNNAIANIATLNFRFFTNQRENKGAEYTSRLPVFYVMDIMINSYLHYKELEAGI